MRQILLSLATLLALQVHATIRTVSNNPSTIAQFNTIQAAVDAAVSGDTILVHGSPNNYAGFAINNKQLVVIGPGWNPNKELPHPVNIVGNTILTGLGTSGTELQGLSFYTFIGINTTGINNVRFIRNRFHRVNVSFQGANSGVFSGYIFQGNWFDNGYVSASNQYSLENMLFQNNIFYHSGVVTSPIYGFHNTVNVLFDHNLFYGTANRPVFGNNTRFVTLSNNIFSRVNVANDLTNASFYNNITFNTNNDAPWTVNGNVDGGGNLAGVDPQMAAQASVNNAVNDPLLDFSIAAGPADNSGSDGKDRGLLFESTGTLNWVNSRTSRLPYIYSMQTNTPTVVPGGSITVTVEARTNN
ncbi:MAG TPA: hypothetical protein VER36_09540 [Flavisolibacter sp.]|nr:hypothetical protein [Flavisolibacter sp.]